MSVSAKVKKRFTDLMESLDNDEVLILLIYVTEELKKRNLIVLENGIFKEVIKPKPKKK